MKFSKTLNDNPFLSFQLQTPDPKLKLTLPETTSSYKNKKVENMKFTPFLNERDGIGLLISDV